MSKFVFSLFILSFLTLLIYYLTLQSICHVHLLYSLSFHYAKIAPTIIILLIHYSFSLTIQLLHLILHSIYNKSNIIIYNVLYIAILFIIILYTILLYYIFPHIFSISIQYPSTNLLPCFLIYSHYYYSSPNYHLIILQIHPFILQSFQVNFFHLSILFINIENH
jgi:hypothetical protein